MERAVTEDARCTAEVKTRIALKVLSRDRGCYAND